MSNVQNEIQAAAQQFAINVVALLRNAKLSQVLSLSGRPAARVEAEHDSDAQERQDDQPAPMQAGSDGHAAGEARAKHRRRSGAEVAKLADRVHYFLVSSRREVGIREISTWLNVPARELHFPLARLRREGAVLARGERRDTVYRAAE